MTEFRPWPRDERYLVGDDGTIIGVWGRQLRPEKHITAPGRDPYFRIKVAGKNHYAHVMVLETYIGSKPSDCDLGRHLNGNSLDNARANLAWGTFSDNAFDKVAHGTHPYAGMTHCKRNHEFTAENTYINPVTGSRQCRSCVRINRNNRRAARRSLISA